MKYKDYVLHALLYMGVYIIVGIPFSGTLWHSLSHNIFKALAVCSLQTIRLRHWHSMASPSHTLAVIMDCHSVKVLIQREKHTTI